MQKFLRNSLHKPTRKDLTTGPVVWYTQRLISKIYQCPFSKGMISVDRANIKARLAINLTCPRCPDTPLLKREDIPADAEEAYCPKCDYYVTFEDAVKNISTVLDALKEEFTAELRDTWQEIVNEMEEGEPHFLEMEEEEGSCAEPAVCPGPAEASDLKMVE